MQEEKRDKPAARPRAVQPKPSTTPKPAGESIPPSERPTANRTASNPIKSGGQEQTTRPSEGQKPSRADVRKSEPPSAPSGGQEATQPLPDQPQAHDATRPDIPEHELAQEQPAYNAAKAVDANAPELLEHKQQIEHLLRNINDKHKQIQMHEASMQALEQLQTTYGQHTSLHIINKLDVLREQIAWLQKEIQATELELHQNYGLSQEDVWELSRWHEQAQAVMPDPAAAERELVAKLDQYQTLQNIEREQRELVYLLARQVAQYGPISVPARLQKELRQQRATLERLRAEMATLEHDLEQAQEAYATDKAADANDPQLLVREQQIERLQSDIKDKHEQIEIHEANIQALERVQANYGLDTPAHIINALRMINAELEQINVQLSTLELELRVVYGLQDVGDHSPVKSTLHRSASADLVVDVSPEQSPITLTARLQRYQTLQRNERELRELVYLLERQAAQYGPLMAPAQMQHELNQQRATLDRLRAEIATLERDLEQEQQAYATAKAADADAANA
ncbi:MAG: hypothetical protein M3R61_14540, partial [Chloroflexota bacterium]|nr:hypothetical protein [Chloroflexota bacterium]